MSEFQLNKNLQERIFFTQLSEIDERLDPLFYKAVERIKNEISHKSKFGYVDLIKTCKITRGRFGHRPRNDPRFYGGDYPFIQTGDIVKASETNGKIKYTQTLNELGLKTSRLFQPPQLLFTIAANIGATAILDYPSCFPDSIVSLTPNEKDLLIEYLDIYLKIIKSYVVDLAPYSAQRNLNNQQLAQVPVIKPPVDIQKKVINIYEAAYNQKQQKEAEAKELLASIDDYLLKKLGITLPEKDNSLKNRIFTTSLNKVSGGRLDPFFYLYCIESPKSSKYPEVELKEIASIVKGQSITSSDVVSGKFPVIAGGQTSPYNHNIYNHNGNVITISASGAYSGYVWYHTIPIFASDCSVVKSQNEIKCVTEYLFNVLKLKQQELYNLQQGSGQPHVYPSDISKISIPLPDNNNQVEINNHIGEIRSKTKQLEQEAQEILEKAKQEVEQMILDAK